MLSLMPTRLFKIMLYVPLLILNGLAILNEDRFLVVVGWSYSNIRGAPSPEDSRGITQQTLGERLIRLIHASQFMRTPLVFVNVVVILFEVLFG